MDRRVPWGCGAALLLALGPWAMVSAADPAEGDTPPPTRQRSPSWFDSWFGPAKKADPKPAATSDKAVVKPPEDPTAARGRERAALLRRQAVCDKLKEVGLRNHDEALIGQADELDRQAWEVYRARTARLPAPAPVRTGPGGAMDSAGATPGHGPVRAGDQNGAGSGTAGEEKP
jgi:hypothetical protein